MHSSGIFEACVMALSLLLLVCAYLMICRKDRSWINWATPSYLVLIGANYVFPMASLFLTGPTGSRFAYVYCYSAYAIPALTGALAYTRIKPLTSSPKQSTQEATIGLLPWVFLFAGLALYIPILLEFKQYLLHPREIYSHTRTGYGLSFFGSAALVNLAVVTYLLKTRKSVAGRITFYSLSISILYLHGSKTQLLVLVLIHMIYWVYVKGARIGAFKALLSVGIVAFAGVASFAVFGDFSNPSEVLLFIASYSDYTSNAMMVIDDPNATRYWGRLTMESEVYSRVPRVIMPDKPKDFGAFKLARIYFPASYRADEGDPSFGIGMSYADFGPFAIVISCAWAGLIGLTMAIAIPSLGWRRHPSLFLIVLFFSEIQIMPLGSGYLLPETLIVAFLLDAGLRINIIPAGLPKFRLLKRRTAR